MITNIAYVDDASVDCITVAVCSVIKWMGKDYEHSFFDSLYFDFTSNDGNNNKRLIDRICIPDNYFSNLEQQCGVKVEYHRDESPTQMLELVKDNLKEGKPVAIVIPYSLCRWLGDSDRFERVNYNILSQAGASKGCIVVGLDVISDSLICVDGIVGSANHIVNFPINDFLNGIRGCYIIKELNVVSDVCNYKELIKKGLVDFSDKKKCNNTFSFQIKELADELSVKELEGELWIPHKDNPRGAPLWRKIRMISEGRLKYTAFIKHISIENNDENLLQFENKITRINNLWDTILSLLLKGCFIKDDTKETLLEKIKNKLYEAADMEMKFIHDLLKYLNGATPAKSISTKTLSEVRYAKKVSTKDFYHIDIKKHFNNKAFDSSILNEGHANLTGQMEFMLEVNSDFEQINDINDFKYKFTKVLINGYDNIACEEQSIEIIPQNYSEVVLIACSVEGPQWANVTLHYENNEIIEERFLLPQWFNVGARYDAQAAWSGTGVLPQVQTKDGSIYTCKINIFYKKIILKHNSKLVNILLPENANIHIFDILIR
jgi:hypothetical protein